MPDPTVCAILLTADRPAMARRAVECFRRQTYPNKLLFGLDTSAKSTPGMPYGEPDCTVMWALGTRLSIGALRNYAIGAMDGWHDADIIVTFDDDDWSHPNRIAEQVAFLQASGAEAVGYDSMLFWRDAKLITNAEVYGADECEAHGIEPRAGADVVDGESWLYSGYPLGTSLCYWRKTWERVQFPDTSYGEDSEWLKRVKWQAQPSLGTPMNRPSGWGEPRMIASIHGGNTSSAYDPQQMREHPEQWRRVPAWDGFIREMMQL